MSVVDPIEYQKRVMTVIKVEKPDLSLLDKTPAFNYVVDKYLEANKPDNYYEYLAILSSKCSSDDEFSYNLIKNKLSINLKSTLLFDTMHFTKKLEEAYTSIYKRYNNGDAPTHIYVRK